MHRAFSLGSYPCALARLRTVEGLTVVYRECNACEALADRRVTSSVGGREVWGYLAGRLTLLCPGRKGRHPDF